MSKCIACDRTFSKVKNAQCKKCKRCYFCHHKEYNDYDCNFFRSEKLKKPRCCCGDNFSIDNPKCAECKNCLSCHISDMYGNCDSCKFTVNPKKVDNKKVSAKQFKCNRLVGVEWEYDRYKNHTGLRNIIKWVSKRKSGHHEDGSCCAEIVTAPIGGDNIKKHLTELGKIINKNVEIDDNCGIHVHVDARDIDSRKMDKIMWLYKKVEPLLYIIAGSDRIDNTYCMPIKNIIRPDGKYYGLNISNWTRKNRNKTTLEFRMQEGTTDTKHVIHWAQLCATLVDFAVRTSVKKLHSLPSSAIQIISTIYPQGNKWMLNCIKKYRKEHMVRERHFSIQKGNWIWNSKDN